MPTYRVVICRGETKTDLITGVPVAETISNEVVHHFAVGHMDPEKRLDALRPYHPISVLRKGVVWQEV